MKDNKSLPQFKWVEWDFEEISEQFQKVYKGSTIAHGDRLILKIGKKGLEEVVVVEETGYISPSKNLLDPNRFENEVAELVKKMGGSYSILVWYLLPEYHSKPRKFVVEVEVSPKFARVLGKLMRKLHKFKGGAFRNVEFKEKGGGEEGVKGGELNG